MNNSYFKLFANCIPVKGARRSIICDLQRNQFDFIPNDLFSILQVSKTKTKAEIAESLSAVDIETLKEYFDFLIEKDYGFWCTDEERNSFPELNLTFQSPSIITNAIIDVDTQSSHDFQNIYSQLEDLGCKHIQIRFFCKMSLDEVYQIINPLVNNRICSVELFIQASEEFAEGELITLCRKNMKVINIVVSGSVEDKSTLVGVDKYTSITFIKEKIENCRHCGNVHYLFFATNIQAFGESLHFNSCLNRKISVDVAGNIKNCPSMEASYGLLKDVSFKEALKHPDFKKVWGIHKDQIEGCMDCEFRHICTDCRAYIKDINNPFSKPSKCNYDPYTATWQKGNSDKNVQVPAL